MIGIVHIPQTPETHKHKDLWEKRGKESFLTQSQNRGTFLHSAAGAIIQNWEHWTLSVA